MTSTEGSAHRCGIADQSRRVVDKVLGQEGVGVGQDILQDIDVVGFEQFGGSADNDLEVIDGFLAQQLLHSVQNARQFREQAACGFGCPWSDGVGLGDREGQWSGEEREEESETHSEGITDKKKWPG